jgi:hypothetical protein
MRARAAGEAGPASRQARTRRERSRPPVPRDTWKARRFDDFQALLADDVTFEGPLGTAGDAAACRAGIEGMSKITTDIVVHTIAADGENVVTMFDLHTTETDEPVLVANWAQVATIARSSASA